MTGITPERLAELRRCVGPETHNDHCVGGFHAPACKLYEIEP